MQPMRQELSHDKMRFYCNNGMPTATMTYSVSNHIVVLSNNSHHREPNKSGLLSTSYLACFQFVLSGLVRNSSY